MDVTDDIRNKFELKIQSGNELLTSLSSFQGVPGIMKLQKKIKQELLFLNKVIASENMKNEHLLSSNIHHFSSLVACILHSTNVVAVLETLSYVNENDIRCKLCVDIVAEKGHRWIKVIARNPKALSQASVGDAEYGQKSIIDHGIEYLTCARQNLHLFEPPQVCFNFTNGICVQLANELSGMGIDVIGSRINIFNARSDDSLGNNLVNEEDSVSNRLCYPDDNNSTTNLMKRFDCIKKINLDVTTLIAYVSSLTNGGENWSFKEPLLNQQAVWERERPVKPILAEILEGREYICCRTAYNEFLEIMRVLGGPSEKARADEFLKKVQIVEDTPFPGLKLCGKIKQRSSLIFGTGHHHKVVTVTANKGFLRAAKLQGVNIAAFVHESRALTEIKQESSSLVQAQS
ncbi:hypothetical protein LSTR_LSTR000498 [Laodelphax striatellus]|uniref:DUF1308 domain-containing protein n=1 Tax=Laodelphax striatellus TaxID=195883 RepID=A0A482X382_LAOST|nr:hypothetical protein LSTR_LSTR000498 [Laodelphax striatellus]